MAMVIHELVTNAAKYGALSTQSGHVSVRWYRKLNGSAQLVIIWQETGGPRVEAPKKSGYGTGVVRDLIPYEFGGTVDFSFAPEGVRCRLEIPFDRVSSDIGMHRHQNDCTMQGHRQLSRVEFAGWARPSQRFNNRKACGRSQSAQDEHLSVTMSAGVTRFGCRRLHAD